MKKLFLIISILILGMSIIGCKEKEHKVWCDYLNREVKYYELDELITKNKITTAFLIKNFESIKWTIDEREDINKILDIIDVSYIEENEVKDSFNSVYELLFKGSNDKYSLEFRINKDNYFYFDAYSSGYISLVVAGQNYVSLTKINFESLVTLCDEILNSLK